MTIFELLFILLALVAIATLITALVLALSGQRVRALRILLRVAISAAVYMVIVVVDSAEDNTVPVVTRYAEKEPRLRCLVNTYGRGPANAIRYGIAAAAAPVAVMTMADGCDDPRQIDDLARLVDRGVAVAAASRYMPGGQQVN